MSATLFTKMGTTFETAIGSFVSGTASNVIDMIAPWILISVTIYFLVTGYMVMAGRISEPLSDILIKGGKIALIAMIGLNSAQFMNYAVGSITDLEAKLLGAVGGQGTASIYGLLDNSYAKGWDAIAQAFEQASNLSFMTEAASILVLILSGFIGILGLVAVTCVGGFIVILSKMALIVVLGLGPFFICCLMFPATAGWFDSWLKTCLNYV